eukprot:281673-Chlamydomonas_euryale.AAC.1
MDLFDMLGMPLSVGDAQLLLSKIGHAAPGADGGAAAAANSLVGDGDACGDELGRGLVSASPGGPADASPHSRRADSGHRSNDGAAGPGRVSTMPQRRARPASARAHARATSASLIPPY